MQCERAKRMKIAKLALRQLQSRGSPTPLLNVPRLRDRQTQIRFFLRSLDYQRPEFSRKCIELQRRECSPNPFREARESLSVDNRPFFIRHFGRLLVEIDVLKAGIVHATG